jgi:hypothetical protein
MDGLDLDLLCRWTPDISRTLVLYVVDRFRRRGQPQEGLAVRGTCTEKHFYFKAGDVSGFDNKVDWFVEVTALMLESGPKGEECERFFHDFLAYIPYDRIVHYESPCRLLGSNLLAGMSNVAELHLPSVYVSEWFVEPAAAPCVYGELLPSLKRLSLRAPRLYWHDWTPLATFLSCRAYYGNQLDSLTIRECPHMCPDVMEDIKGMAKRVEVLLDNRFEYCGREICVWEARRRGGVLVSQSYSTS